VVFSKEVNLISFFVCVSPATVGWPPVPCHVHVYVAYVDAAYVRALANGGVSVQEPAQRGDPDKRGGVKGPGDVTWWISTQVE
jgi:uncharacterized glyoxalase superfamily protein PhnB